MANDDDDNEYIVACYDPSQDNWTTLPPLPVRFFALGQVNGKLVAVGGMKKGDDRATNEVFTYDERSREWKQTIPPMPTARNFSDVLSLQSALVVAGGITSRYEYTGAVEIYKADTSKWYRTNPLPTACSHLSLVVIGNTCYALGGYNGQYLNQVLYSSVDDLLHNTVLANLYNSGSSVNTHSAWKTLANTPTYVPAAAVLADNLLALRGNETSNGGAGKKEVYMFSPSTNSWIYISNLPEATSETAVAVLSSTEILAIGGRSGRGRVNTTYKGTLQFLHFDS